MYEVHIEPEFTLVLVRTGPNRARVIVKVRQLLNVSPADARRRVDEGEVVVAGGLTHWSAGQLKAEFDALGALVEVR